MPLGDVRRVQLLGLFNALMYDAGVLEGAPGFVDPSRPAEPDFPSQFDPDSDPWSAPFEEELR